MFTVGPLVSNASPGMTAAFSCRSVSMSCLLLSAKLHPKVLPDNPQPDMPINSSTNFMNNKIQMIMLLDSDE